MNNPSTSEKFAEVIREIQKRSVSDQEFRALALQSPSAAFESIAGFALPVGVKIRFVTQLEEIVVVLPPVEGSAEISDAELGSVAGGLVYTPSTLGGLSGYGCAS